MNLQDARMEIDAIDGQLAALFERRMALAAQVADYKRRNGLPVLDAARERQVMDRAEERVAEPALKAYARRFMAGLMALSRERQTELLKAEPTAFACEGPLGYLGPEGSFSHAAATAFFGEQALQPATSFEELVRGVEQGRWQRALLPVENSLTGAVTQAVDLLAGSHCAVVGETVHSVRLCLLGMEGAAEHTVKTALSHPQPLEQCQGYLKGAGMAAEARASTAQAAREVAARQDPSLAAVGSEQAAALYGLKVLKRGIEDDPANFTRFAVIAPRGAEVPPGADKISAVFTLEHRAGSLYDALRTFADRGINLLSLQSRPIAGSPWQYRFHMDFAGNLGDEDVMAAIAEISGSLRSWQVLGCYKKWEG